jgi:acyl-CoA thioester hydrolase
MAGAGPCAIGIRATGTDRATVCGHAGKQREVTAMMRTAQELRDSSMSTKILAPRLADFSVASVEKLRFADTDLQGHITNTVFAVCCQNARMELLCDPQRVPIPPNTQFVIARLVLEFRAEMHWPGTVEIGTRVERVGRSSATLAQALFVRERCVAVAESVVALVNTTYRRPAHLPLETVEALRALARNQWQEAPTLDHPPAQVQRVASPHDPPPATVNHSSPIWGIPDSNLKHDALASVKNPLPDQTGA